LKDGNIKAKVKNLTEQGNISYTPGA
jgi:hypothetical protein